MNFETKIIQELATDYNFSFETCQNVINVTENIDFNDTNAIEAAKDIENWCNKENDIDFKHAVLTYFLFKMEHSDLKENVCLNYGTTTQYRAYKEVFWADLFELLKALHSKITGQRNELQNNLKQLENSPKQPPQLSIPDEVLNELQKQGFINDATAKPIMWAATNKTTKGKTINKKSLLDLLCILNFPDEVIKNRKLLNSYFSFPNGKPLQAQNYTDITDTARKIKRPIISQFHNDLVNIVEKSKEK